MQQQRRTNIGFFMVLGLILLVWPRWLAHYCQHGAEERPDQREQGEPPRKGDLPLLRLVVDLLRLLWLGWLGLLWWLRLMVVVFFFDMGYASGDGEFHGIGGTDVCQQTHAVALHEVEAPGEGIRLRDVNGYVVLQTKFAQLLLGDESHLPYVGRLDADQYGFVEFALVAGKCLEEIFEGTIDQFDAGRALQYFIE